MAGFSRWLKSRKPRPAARPHRARLTITPLEAREVPAAVLENGVLTITGDDGGVEREDIIELRSPTPGQLIVRVNGQQQFSGSADLSRVVIDGRGFVDRVAIKGVPTGIEDGVVIRQSEIVGFGEQNPSTLLFSMANVRSNVRVEETAFLNLFDTASTANRTVVVGEESVTGLAPGRISYSFVPGALVAVRTGSGAETFRIDRSPDALVQYFGGAGADTFDLRSSAGGVVIAGQGGVDTIDIAATARSLNQLAEQVTINDGTFRDRVTIHDDRTAEGLTLFDSYTATLTENQLRLDVDARTQIGEFLVSRNFNRTINFNGVGSVDFRAAARPADESSIEVRSLARFTQMRVDVGAAERIRVGSTAGSLNPVMGRLTIAGGERDSRLVLDDSGALAGRNFRIQGARISYPDPQLGERSIQIGDFLGEFVEIEAGRGNDRFTADSGRAIAPEFYSRWVVVDGNAGTDTLVGRDQNTGFVLTGPNEGGLRGMLIYSDTEFLTGRGGDDFFIFLDGASLSGRIDGGGGFNTLDYSPVTTPVAVNLVNGTATGVQQGAANIRVVFGGSAADRLTGNAGDNVLAGNGGADILDGGFGRDVLIGGAGADQLFKPGGSGLFIGGDVDPIHRNNFTSMKDILTAWQQPTSVAARVADLATPGEFPNPGVVLNSETLDGDGAADRFLTTVFGSHAFYRDALDVFVGPPVGADEVVIDI